MTNLDDFNYTADTVVPWVNDRGENLTVSQSNSENGMNFYSYDDKEDSSELLKNALSNAELYDKDAAYVSSSEDPRNVASVYACQIKPAQLNDEEYAKYLDLAVMLDPTTESKTLAEELNKKMASAEAAEFMTNEQLKSFAMRNYNNMTKEQFDTEMKGSPNLEEIVSPENIERRQLIAQDKVLQMVHQSERAAVSFPDLKDYEKGNAMMKSQEVYGFSSNKDEVYRNTLTKPIDDFVKKYQNTISPQITADKEIAGVDKPDPNIVPEKLNNIEPPKNGFLSKLVNNVKNKMSSFNKQAEDKTASLNSRFNSGSYASSQQKNNSFESGYSGGDYGG